MDLSNLRPADGSKQSDNFRRGRGHGSGNGKTAGKGHKGQKARSGATRPGFEGGQMPLQRRLPKFGFKNHKRVEFKAINLSVLEDLATKKTLNVVNIETLAEAGIVSKNDRIKILGNGKLSKQIEVTAHAFSKSATQAIEAAGGKAVKL